MERIMRRFAFHTTATQQQCSVVLPLDIWAIIFEESARDAELHLTLHAVKKPFNIKANFVNAPISFLSLCTTSRETILKHLVLFVDVPDVTEVQQILPSTILKSIRHIKRTLTIASIMSIQTHKELDMDCFPALQKLDVLVRHQLRRNTNPAIMSNRGEAELRKDEDYKYCVLLAGGHFTRLDKQSVNAMDFAWARYWRYPQLEESITSIEDNLGELSLQLKETVKISIKYEIMYRIRLGPGHLARVASAGMNNRGNAAPEKTVVVSWNTKFPTHEITEKEVIDA